MAAHAYATAQDAPFDNTTAAAILKYQNALSRSSLSPVLPQLPVFNDTAGLPPWLHLQANWGVFLQMQVPKIDKNLFFTVGLGFV